MLISFGCMELFSGSVTDLWLYVSPLQQIDSVLNKAEVGDYTVDCVGIKLLVGFMIVSPSIKSPLTPKTKSLTLCASAGASKCEEKVKKGSWHVIGFCSCFYNNHALTLGTNTVRLQVWFQQQAIHPSLSRFSEHLPAPAGRCLKPLWWKHFLYSKFIFLIAFRDQNALDFMKY